MKRKIYTLGLISLIIPKVSFAALEGVKGLLLGIQGLMNSIVPLIFGLAMIFFFWGIVQFILKDAANDKTREEGKKKILWGLIALFVFVSVYGLINFIGATLNINTTNGVSPRVPTSSTSGDTNTSSSGVSGGGRVTPPPSFNPYFPDPNNTNNN